MNKKINKRWYCLWFVAMFAFSHASCVNSQDYEPWDTRLVFVEDFDSLDVTEWGKHGSRWLAHTPWNGDFGQAKFVYEGFNNPFSIADGVLKITARKAGKQRWTSGLLALNAKSSDYESFEFGYFEAKMKFPGGPGLWPAFWLIGENRELFTAEIDIVEYYGRETNEFSTNAHVWKAHKGGENTSFHKKVSVEPGTLQDEFNLFGVDIRQHELVFYLNRKEYWRIQKPTEFYNIKFFPLINLAMTKYNQRLDADKYVMHVDYVHIYAKVENL